MPIYSLVYCIMAEESASINGLKYLMPRLKSAMVAGEMEVSNLYKIFPNLLL